MFALVDPRKSAWLTWSTRTRNIEVRLLCQACPAPFQRGGRARLGTTKKRRILPSEAPPCLCPTTHVTAPTTADPMKMSDPGNRAMSLQ